MNEMTTNNHADREHALLSASSAHRWLVCPASAVAAEAYPAQDTEFTREGTRAHEVAEAVTRSAVAHKNSWTVPTGEDGEGLPLDMVNHAEGYRDYILEQLKGPEAVVLLEQRVDFSPWVPDGFGTADCIIIQGDTMDVIDYKYGQGVPVLATDNPQAKLYGLGALNDYGIAYDVERIRLHIYQPRLNNISVDELTAADLMDWANNIVKPIAGKAAKGKGGYKAGGHCKFCPHAGKCRTLHKTCTEFVEMHDLRVGVPVLAPHEVAGVLEMESLVNLWLKRVKAQALDTLLSGGEVPGYKVVEGKQGNRKWTADFQVLEVLKGAGYSMEDVTETKLLSPAGMDKALGKKRVTELLEQFIDRAPGAPTLAPASDKRPVYNRLDEAKKDFESERR